MFVPTGYASGVPYEGDSDIRLLALIITSFTLHLHHAVPHRHVSPSPQHMQIALASWYDDGVESTACGDHVTHGFAHLPEAGWPCGTRIRFCYGPRCVIGIREDSGPYVSGRTFDLTPSLKEALRCGDLCYVRWKRV